MDIKALEDKKPNYEKIKEFILQAKSQGFNNNTLSIMFLNKELRMNTRRRVYALRIIWNVGININSKCTECGRVNK